MIVSNLMKIKNSVEHSLPLGESKKDEIVGHILP